MSYLVDSNILCRLSDTNCEQYDETRKAIRLLLVEEQEMFLIPQVEREFWVVSTRPLEGNGLGLSSEEAAERLAEFRGFLEFRRDSSRVHNNWRELVVAFDVKGKVAHDAGIVAAALTHQAKSILTFNSRDFRRYSDRIGSVTPRDVMGKFGA